MELWEAIAKEILGGSISSPCPQGFYDTLGVSDDGDDDADDDENDGWTGEAIEACWGGWSSAQSRELVRSCRNVITNIEEKYGSKNILRITVEK